MACGVTLKRAIDLDALHSPEHSMKRRRTSCNHSPYHPAASGFAVGASQVGCGGHHNSEQRPPTMFENTAANNAKVSSDELYAFLRKELHLLRKRRAPNEPGSPTGGGYSRGSDSPLSDSDGEQQQQQQQQQASFIVQQPHAATAMEFQSGGAVSLRDKPLFSFTQVRNICERLLKEQETRLSIEYDKVLNEKLAEQHETFVRFTYDQIHRRYEDSPMSYLS